MRTQISLQEKLEIYEYRQRNPAISFNNMAKFFSEKWDKKISKTAVYASYTLIKGEKAKGTKFETSDMGRFRIDSSKIIEFEHELYSQINARLLKQALTFELIKILALRLQKSDKYTSEESVEKGRDWH